MVPISDETLLAQLRWRYAVKKFDPTKLVPESTWGALEESLVLTPSSYGLQPWKFIVVQSPELKKQLRSHSWNQSQVEDCSHYVVFTARKHISETDVDSYIHRMAEVRGVTVESLAGLRRSIVGDIINGARSKYAKEWAVRQLYIALGNFMTAAALLGVDACPMEGLNAEKYDEVLGLQDGPWTVAVACAAGYRHPDDFLGKARKVRFPADSLIERR